jgi:hypothetical protein
MIDGFDARWNHTLDAHDPVVPDEGDVDGVRLRHSGRGRGRDAGSEGERDNEPKSHCERSIGSSAGF